MARKLRRDQNIVAALFVLRLLRDIPVLPDLTSRDDITSATIDIAHPH